MQSVKDLKVLGKERLERIVEMCIAIENRLAEPFTLDVDEIIRVLKDYFPQWRNPEELKLDAEALHHLATIIKMQSEWVKERSTALYTDPFLLEEKIAQIGKQQMVDVFLRAWNPLIEFEQLNLATLAQGLLYWEALAPIGERWKSLEMAEISNSFASRDELIRQRILSDKEFTVELNSFWQELKELVAKKTEDGKIEYWSFVDGSTYEETTQRAFLTSFLVTYGYANLEIDSLEELVYVKPFEQQRTDPPTQQSTSVPIAVSYQDWQKRKRGKSQ